MELNPKGWVHARRLLGASSCPTTRKAVLKAVGTVATAVPTPPFLRTRILAIAWVLVFFCQTAQGATGAELDRLVGTIIQAESSGREKAVGDGGKARGLMQIQEATWKSYSAYPWSDAFDGDKNIQVGRHILEDINERYARRGVDATIAQVVFTYNTGRYAYTELPAWTKRHPNNIYRAIFQQAKP